MNVRLGSGSINDQQEFNETKKLKFSHKKANIILLVGYAGVGKTTFANYLVDKFSDNTNNIFLDKYSFAYPMKKVCQEIFMLDKDQLWGKKKDKIDKRLGITPRRLLQIIGTEIFQYDIYNHLPELLNTIPLKKLWVYRFKWWYEEIKNSVKEKTRDFDEKRFYIIIDDGRFSHEAEEIRKMGGMIIRLNRKGIKLSSDHKSETEMNKITPDLIIDLEEGLDNMYAQIDKLLNILGVH